jgi:dihydroorotate dehydrogenase
MDPAIYKIGNIQFKHPILHASGCWCINETQINELYKSSLAGVICKTCTFSLKEGNKEINYSHDEERKVHFNCKGLPNLGYQYYKNLYKQITDKPYIMSLAIEHFDDLQAILLDYDTYVSGQSLVEINLSCPNLKHSIPGYDITQMKVILVFLRNLKLKNIIFGLKLPPYLQLDVINEMAMLFNEFTDILKYIVLSNSVPNCLPLKNGSPFLSNTFGGLSGKLNKYIALSNVYSFSKILSEEIKIVGCGGIETIDDVNDYLNNGASFVQLASCFYDETSNKLDVNKINELIGVYSKKNKINEYI